MDLLGMKLSGKIKKPSIYDFRRLIFLPFNGISWFRAKNTVHALYCNQPYLARLAKLSSFKTRRSPFVSGARLADRPICLSPTLCRFRCSHYSLQNFIAIHTVTPPVIYAFNDSLFQSMLVAMQSTPNMNIDIKMYFFIVAPSVLCYNGSNKGLAPPVDQSS
jgi:hypothetical protein